MQASAARSRAAASSSMRPVPVLRAVVRVQAAGAPATNGAVKKAPKPAAAAGPFTNTNRFKVSQGAAAAFEAAWRAREADMRAFPGFQEFTLERAADGENFTVKSTWASIPQWEAWSLSPECRRSHLPLGIWQYVPARGEGFPEDFVFFLDYDKAVDAKY